MITPVGGKLEEIICMSDTPCAAFIHDFIFIHICVQTQ